jgi:tetratricopeptide (TPR) repeat protein
MRKTLWTILAVLAVLACGGVARAGEPKTEKPKAEKPKAEKPKAEQSKKEEPKKESLEERQQRRKKAFDKAANKEPKDFDKALAILDEMLADKEISDEDRLIGTFNAFKILVEQKHDGAKACPLAKKLGKMKKDDAEVLNQLAWMILDTPKLKNRDLDLALTIAKQAAEVSKYLDYAILDTLARAYFEKGDLDKAIEFQRKAVEKAKNNDMVPEDARAELKDTLEKYKAKKSEKK